MTARHYDPMERPACWVWHDHQFPPGWYPGYVHAWHRLDNWHAMVTYACPTEKGDLQFHHDVPAAWVRRREDGPGDGPPA